MPLFHRTCVSTTNIEEIRNLKALSRRQAVRPVPVRLFRIPVYMTPPLRTWLLGTAHMDAEANVGIADYSGRGIAHLISATMVERITIPVWAAMPGLLRRDG